MFVCARASRVDQLALSNCHSTRRMAIRKAPAGQWQDWPDDAMLWAICRNVYAIPPHAPPVAYQIHIQIFHLSVQPTGASATDVDVWINRAKSFGSLRYGEATPMLSAPNIISLEITPAGGAPSAFGGYEFDMEVGNQYLFFMVGNSSDLSNPCEIRAQTVRPSPSLAEVTLATFNGVSASADLFPAPASCERRALTLASMVQARDIPGGIDAALVDSSDADVEDTTLFQVRVLNVCLCLL